MALSEEDLLKLAKWRGCLSRMKDFKRGYAGLARAIISSTKSQATETRQSEERTRRDEFE